MTYSRILSVALTLFTAAQMTARQCEQTCFKSTLCDIKYELSELNKSQPCTKVITAKDIGTNGYVISDPGYYCLGEDVNFAPTQPYTAAIKTLANNVTINLEGHTLQQTNQASVPNVYGILIGEGLSYTNPNAVFNNITVVNGTIEFFSGDGIFSYNGSFDGAYPTYQQIPFTNLFFSDLNILGCGTANVSPLDFYDTPGGIVFNSNAPFLFTSNFVPTAFNNVVINRCAVNESLGISGIAIYTVDSLVIQDTQANDLFCSTENQYWDCFAYDFSGTNIQMFNCQGNRATSYDQSYDGQVGGIFCGQSQNVYLSNCQFNSAYGDTDFLVNNNFSICVNGVCENCQFNDNQGGAGAFFVAGVHSSGSPDYFVEGSGMRWINCQFNGSSVNPSNPYVSILTGFLSAYQKNMIFDTCQACNITTTGDCYLVTGFLNIAFDGDMPSVEYSDGNNITFRNCVVSEIQGSNHTMGYSVGGGDLDYTGTQLIHKNMVFENCIAEHINSSSDVACVAGIAESLIDYSFLGQTFMYPQQINLFVRDCRISDVSSNGSPLSAGIIAQSVQYPVIIGNSVSDCDRGILLTGTTTIIPNGFELAATSFDATTTPPIYIPITAPTGSAVYSFTNLRLGKTVLITPDQISNSFVLPTTDLTAEGWLPGDPVLYTKSNVTAPDVPGLVNGTTYYAIVYIPGFSVNGVIQNNEVDNCTVNGYQDDSPDTSSAWLNNTAILNANNYDITWSVGPNPIETGSVKGPYPTPGNKYYNLSLTE